MNDVGKYNRVPDDYPQLPENWKRKQETQAAMLKEAQKLLAAMLARQGRVPASAHVLPATRIGDKSRDRVVRRLNAAFETGHLTLAELDARTDWALAATTTAQLTEITADLPPWNDLPVAQPAQPEPSQTRWDILPDDAKIILAGLLSAVALVVVGIVVVSFA